MFQSAGVFRAGLAALGLVLSCRAQTVILRLQCLNGEGAVYTAGTRTARPAMVLVSDETGAPVSGAMVSFRLPEDGVTGQFTNAMKTDVAITGADGLAPAPGIAWGGLAGPATLRVTAAKDQARAGLLVSFFVALPEAGGAGAAGPRRKAGESPSQSPRVRRSGPGAWRWLLPVAAGGAAAMALGVTRGNSGAASGAAAAGAGTASTAVGPAVSVGAPAFTVSKP